MSQDVSAFPTLYDSQITVNDSGAAQQPGQVFFWKGGTGRVKTAWVKYIKLDSSGCSRGEALVEDPSALTGYTLYKATAAMSNHPVKGIAAATISGGNYGFIITDGYAEQVDSSITLASGDYIYTSGSTAGKVTNIGGGGYALGFANGAFATGVGSATIFRWG